MQRYAYVPALTLPHLLGNVADGFKYLYLFLHESDCKNVALNRA